MAQVVDTKGNVRANPKTGKVNGTKEQPTSNPSGVSRLRSDLGLNNLGVNNSKPSSTNKLSDYLDEQFSIPVGRIPSLKSFVSVPSTPPMNASSLGTVGGKPSTPQAEDATISSFPSLSSSMPPGTASASGDTFTPSAPISWDWVVEDINDNTLKPIFGVDVNRDYDAWEQAAAERENREVRTKNVFDEPYDTNDNDNILGLDYSYAAGIGNNPVNDTYTRYFIDNGMSVDDAYALTHRPQTIDSSRKMRDERDVSPDFFDGSGEYLDDGSFNYWQLTSDAMTGTQYLKYRDELGMGGRNNIDPSGVYSKREEARTYDFHPFTPDLSTQASMVTQDLVDAPYELGRNIAEGRTLVSPDYQLNYKDRSGEKHSVSGKGVDNEAPAFLNRFYYDREYNPDKFVTKPEDDSPYSTYVNQYKVPDVNGNDTYHYGHLVDVYQMQDGTYQFSFSDGSSVRTDGNYFNSVYDDFGGSVDIGNPERVPLQLTPVDVDAMGPDAHRGMINETIVPDINGNDTVHYGDLENVGIDYNGNYVFSFQDGSSVSVSKDYFDNLYDEETGNVSYPEFNRVWIDDMQNDVNLDELGISLEDEEPQTYNEADVIYLPDLVLPDGNRIALEDVERLVMDKTPENDKNEYGISDDDISYDFANSPIPTLNNRPHRLGGQEFITDDGIDTSNVMNNAVDWSLGSLPISIPGLLPWIYSASGASRAISGIDPMSYDPVTKSYKLNAGFYDKDGNLRFGEYDEVYPEGVNPEQVEPTKVRNDERSNDIRWSNTLGSLAVPFSEMIVGPIGEEIIPIGKLANKVPVKSATGRWLVDATTGAAGEGIEEVLGNVFDELSGYGPSGAFANPILDEEGMPDADMYGHERRKIGQPLWLRSDNYVSDLQGNGNAFLGGMLVDATLGLLPGVRGLNNAIMDDRRVIQSGAPLYIRPDDIDEYEKLDDDYVTRVNESMRR